SVYIAVIAFCLLTAVLLSKNGDSLALNSNEKISEKLAFWAIWTGGMVLLEGFDLGAAILPLESADC
ncbi:hypothetical protein G9A89_001772, partial [Geosiphon pyriformis]